MDKMDRIRKSMRRKDLIALDADKSLKEKFDSLVVKTKTCHVFQKTTDQGYGYIYIASKTRMSAHRFALLMKLPPPHDGMYACHKCPLKSCVNPRHLYWGDPADNIEDQFIQGTARRVKGVAHHRSKLTPEKARSIAITYINGLKSQQQIAEEFNISNTAVKCIVERRTWADATSDLPLAVRSKDQWIYKRGEQRINAKLTESEATEVIACINAGEKDPAISSRYGVDRKTIADIRYNVTWTHLPRIYPSQTPRAIAKHDLSRHQVENIWNLYHVDRLTLHVIAQRYLLTNSVVRNVTSRVSYKQWTDSLVSRTNHQVCIVCQAKFLPPLKRARKKTCSAECLSAFRAQMTAKTHADGRMPRK